MKTKKCSKCGIEKPLEEFCKDKSRKDGYAYLCKVCHNAHTKEWHKKNPTYKVGYVRKNRAKINEQQRERRRKNPEYHRAYSKQYDHHRRETQPACVYQIVNSVNNKVYIGETIRGEIRWKGHLSALRGNYHKNHKLQADFNKFGEDAFEWSIIKEYPKDRELLESKEKQLIEQYEKEGKQLYNIYMTENK